MSRLFRLSCLFSLFLIFAPSALAEASELTTESVVALTQETEISGVEKAADDFRAGDGGAKILLKEVPDPERFGVAELDGDQVISIVEKPKDPKTNLAVIGIYMYDPWVFQIIRDLEPSERGELEITDVNNAYIREGRMSYQILDGWWTDAGTFGSLHRASNMVYEGGANRVD